MLVSYSCCFPKLKRPNESINQAGKEVILPPHNNISINFASGVIYLRTLFTEPKTGALRSTLPQEFSKNSRLEGANAKTREKSVIALGSCYCSSRLNRCKSFVR